MKPKKKSTGASSKAVKKRLAHEVDGEGRGEDQLEHAVARAALDAWSHGLGSPESVGQAYAALGDHLAYDTRKHVSEKPDEDRPSVRRS